MIAFVHIQKTAGTTLTSILRRSFGIRHFDTRGVRNLGCISADELRKVAVVYRNLESIAGHSVRPFGDLHVHFPLIRYYTFLREPIARTMSHFAFDIRRSNLDLNTAANLRQLIRDYLAKVRNTQTIHLAGCENADAAIEIIRQRIGFVGLVERFDESLTLFRRWAGVPRLDISYVSQNVSSRARVPGQNLLRDLVAEDPEIAMLIAEANQEDLRLYRWVADELYPVQCREYGAKLDAEVLEFKAAIARPNMFWFHDSLMSKVYRNVVFKPWRILSGLARSA